MNEEVLSVDKLSEEIKKTSKELQELRKGLDNLSALEKNNKIKYYDNIISSYFEKLEDLQTETGINKLELNKLRLQTYFLKLMYNDIENEVKGKTLSEMNRLEKAVNKNRNNSRNTGNQDKGNDFLHTLGGAGLIGWGAVQLDKLFSRKKYEESITGYKDMSKKEKRKARRKWRKDNKISFWERPFGRFLKRTGTGFGLISGINTLKDYINGKKNHNTPNPGRNGGNENPENGGNGNEVNGNESNDSNENVFQRRRESKEKISKKKVTETWNYIKNGGTFYSPTKGRVTRGESKYKGVCSTGSYNVLWRLGLPKVSDSLEVDLDGSVLPKMGLNYVGTVDPDNPGKDGYKPQDGDTAVRPRFVRTTGKHKGETTQHQATFINGSWVSDTIQTDMSCYGDPNEPRNVKIYRYHGESSETPSGNVADYALKSAKAIASNNKYGYKRGGKGGDNGYDCCGLVCSVYRDAFKKAGLKEDKIPFTSCYYMKDVFKKAGFKWISPYDRSKLKPGDIMLDEDKHTEIYAGNGQTIGAHRDIDGKSGDSSGNEISLTDKKGMGKYFLDTYHKQYGWDGILRYEG